MNQYNDLQINGESIRIRFAEDTKKQLFLKSQRIGKSVSEIVRDAVSAHLNALHNQ